MHVSSIHIKGAREHNLKNIDLSIPRDVFTVITGLSGSGKSSLAFDTLYSEAQRRFVESLSSYARQFLGLMEKPDVDSIEGLSPAIAIEQKTTGHNPRSTVGTITEIHDYLRLLFARIGTPTCYRCGKVISRQTVQEMTDRIMRLAEGTKFLVISPVVSGRKGEYRDLFEKLRKDGFLRVVVDSVQYTLDEEIALDKNKKHSIGVVVDRLINGRTIKSRLTETIETALRISTDGTIRIESVGEKMKPLVFSEKSACPECGVVMEALSPRMFSFNSPFGACPACTGLGFIMEIDPQQCVPDPTLSIEQGAIVAWNGASSAGSWSNQILSAVCGHFSIPMDIPFEKLSKKQRNILFYGSGSEKITMQWEARSREGKGFFKRPFEGVVPNLIRRYRETSSEDIRRWIEGFMSRRECGECNGGRLKPESLAVKVDGRSIAEISSWSIEQSCRFFDFVSLTKKEKLISHQILKEIRLRLDFLCNVGLSYLTLGRAAATLSGGEAQRIRLATQIGSQLTGVMYILDEPSIGLHPRDTDKLLATLKRLRDLGNTIIVIEHDRETMMAADHLVDIGPGAGVNGGRVVASGTPEEVAATPESLTGAYLSGKRAIRRPRKRRTGNGGIISITNASGNNLKNIDVNIPLGMLVGITGVSGSGKSSLINHTLYPALQRHLYRSKTVPLPFGKIGGLELVDKVIGIDQSPIGKTPRSNPATYTKTLDLIRDLFAALPESKIRGYSPGRFSFNVKGGRCETCEGDGLLKIEMHFLPDVYVPCESCGGKRYNRETLEILYKGRSIAEILDMTIDEALLFFGNISAIRAKLEVISRVGLGYLKLGQPANTLSGGEAQRIKLAAELGRRTTGNTLYIMDEPTTGLHFEDIVMLMSVVQELVDKGNTVVVIEHNLDVIKCSDYIVDLGPEGGDGGGRIVATGTPEQIIRVKESYTGKFLKKAIEQSDS